MLEALLPLAESVFFNTFPAIASLSCSEAGYATSSNEG